MSNWEAVFIGGCCGVVIGGIPIVFWFLLEKYMDWRYQRWYDKWVKNGSDWTKM